jgi:hypothetical protein
MLPAWAQGLPIAAKVSSALASKRTKQGFIDWPTDASGMWRQLSPAADIAFDRLW